MVDDLASVQRLGCDCGGIVTLPAVQLEGTAVGIVVVGCKIAYVDLQQLFCGIKCKAIADRNVKAAHVGRTGRAVFGKAERFHARVCLLGMHRAKQAKQAAEQQCREQNRKNFSHFFPLKDRKSRRCFQW